MDYHYRTAEEVKADLCAKPRRALVLTTVTCESRAVRSHLADRETIRGSNNALYDLGRFSEPAGDWAVVQAFCQSGNNDATAVVMKAIADFGKFDVVMFVGVAGSLKDDVPIGSVVAGNFVYNSHSGKEEDGGFRSRPHSYPAANELLHAANALILDGTWIDLIKAPELTALPAVEEYPCPYPPEAVIKAIASGEQVVAGGKGPQYGRIRRHLNDAAAVEMEGYGTMTAAHQESTPAIVVRGISDMCTGKDHVRDKLDQPIAAAHAAAFAFGILSIRSKASPLTPDGSKVLTEIPGTEKHASRPDERVDYLVNFKGSIADWRSDEIERVVAGLRNVTSDPELVLVRFDERSMILSVRATDIPTLTVETIRTAVGEVGRDIVGALSVRELAGAEEAKAQLKGASADLLSWKKALPGWGWIDRPEQWAIASRFMWDSSSTVVLGDPGSGKSTLLAAMATDLVERRASVLAIKADFLSADVQTEHALQAELGLMALPGDLIQRLARLEPVFLFVDQLDALASQLDLRSDRLNVLLNLVRRVGGLHNVHVVLSARTFEFNHDVRLRAIEADAVTLTLPAWHEVKQKLSAAGINADLWPDNAREVVRNPQALKIYLSLANANEDQPFSKYQSMLEELWRQKIARAPESEALASLASDVAGAMAEEETLWLAASRFDTRAPTVERLESVGLIVRSDNGQSIAFSHQTVFEYVLARTFVRAAGRLSAYVLERQNSLFVRGKLWSALRYLRDSEIATYEREFLGIWREAGLRRHLRLLLIEFLGEQQTPVAFEKLCFEEVMQSNDLRSVGLKAIAGSAGWFANFARSAIPAAMTASRTEATQALRILERAWSFSPDEITRLLREHWLPTPAKDAFTWTTLEACPKWTEPVEEIARTILSRTPITSWEVDYTSSVLAVEQPEVAFRLVRAKLDFLLDKARSTPRGSPFPEKGTIEEEVAWYITEEPTKPFTTILEGAEWNSLPSMAEANPQKFIEVLWPWFRAVLGELKDRCRQDAREDVFPQPYSFDADFELGDSRRFADKWPLISSLRLAVEAFAKNGSASFLEWVERNNDLELMISQRLIAHGFSSSPQTYSQQALNWLFDDTRRLQLGGLSDRTQTTAALIGAVSPFWTEDQVRDFESRLEKYRVTAPSHITQVEDLRHFSQSIRATKARLLGAVSVERLSDKSRELLAAEKRALGEDLESGIRVTGMHHIGSPMEAVLMTKAKDRDILKIFKEIPDDTDWEHPTNWMRGGNVQLSRAFAEFAKAEPERALRIMEEFNPRAQERAAGYALESIAELGAYDREIQEALLSFHQRGFGEEEFRSSAARALEKIANRPTAVDESVVIMLTKWLRRLSSDEDDPSDVLATNEKDDGERTQDLRQQSILWGRGGFSVLPGGTFPILSALTSVLLAGKEEGRDRLLAILNDHLGREGNPKVWQALLPRLSNAGGSTPKVVSEFVRALFKRFPTLLETREAIYFLAYAHRWDDALAYDLVAAWERAENPMLRQAQGELVGLVAIVKPADRWTSMQDHLVKQGSPEAKIGLAHAAANLWVETQFHIAAGQLLEQLISDADKDRISVILDVFRVCDDLIPEPATLALLRALAAPEVEFFDAPSIFIVEKLQSLLPHAADVVGAIALKLVNAWRSDLSDVQSEATIAAPQLIDLAITLHRLGGASRETGVTIFEALIDADAYGARDTLTEIDGRFGTYRAGVRRRIVRRKSGHAKNAAA